MKVVSLSLILGFLMLFSVSADSYPPEGWTADVLEALAESEKTGKDILLNFTGSDWCVWCHKLWDEVFATKEFVSYAEDNLVLLFLDYPNGISQSDELKHQNEVMAGLFGVQGFPTIWLMDSEQLPVMKTGYRQGGAESYIEHLKNDRPTLDDETQKQFIQAVRDTVSGEIGSW